MLGYLFIDLFLFFIFFSSLGWVIEIIYVYIGRRVLTSPGFHTGPYSTAYGAGAVLIILINKLLVENIHIGIFGFTVISFFIFSLSASILEYFSGLFFYKIFKFRLWSYETQRFNLGGHVCLKVSIFWGILGFILTKFLNPVIELMFLIPGDIKIFLFSFLLFILIVDTIFSTVRILRFKNIVVSIVDSGEAINLKLNKDLKKYKGLFKKTIKDFKKNDFDNDSDYIKELVIKERSKINQSKK